ncbi:hypothetical protein AURDEDRAFT_181549 [Auricularia subglabra TFB-10046 SS5]|nr:hypothetical protein AURDEDRAFT_181549 [Auricularia subglabra TFB-10046 SS5]
MLLRLIPSAPFPTVLFTLTFPSLPDDLPLPHAWLNVAETLQTHDLPPPPCIHALDAATAPVALIDTVTFDLAHGELTCSWIDGAAEAHPIPPECISALEQIVEDVSLASIEAQREQHRARAAECPPTPHSSLNKPPAAVAQSQAAKHKRRRSTFFSMVSAILSSTSSANSAPAPPSQAELYEPEPVPAPAPAPVQVPASSTVPAASAAPAAELAAPNRGPRSRFLRRRARSLLVDTFRRFVLPLYPARQSYDTWSIASLLRRTALQARDVLDRAAPVARAAGVRALPCPDADGDDDDAFPPWPYLDDEESDDSCGSDGDGASCCSSTVDESSVDTPREGELDVFVAVRSADAAEDDDPFFPRAAVAAKQQLASARPPSATISQAHIDRAALAALAEEYIALQTHASKLRVLRAYLDGQRERVLAEECAFGEALEERAVRRASSSLGFASRSVASFVASRPDFSRPFARSPLAAQRPATLDEPWEDDDEADWPSAGADRASISISVDEGRKKRRMLGMRRTRSSWDVKTRIYHRAAVVASANNAAAATMASSSSVAFPCSSEDEAEDVLYDDDGYPLADELDAFDIITGSPTAGLHAYADDEDAYAYTDLASPVEEEFPRAPTRQSFERDELDFAPQALRRSLEADTPALRPTCIPSELPIIMDDAPAPRGSLLRAAVRRRLPSFSLPRLRRETSDDELDLERGVSPIASLPSQPVMPVSPPRPSVRGMLASLSGMRRAAADVPLPVTAS